MSNGKGDNNNKQTCNCQVSIADRYRLLINARNFHYDHYNKWTTYFYVMIGAVVLGISNIISKTKGVTTDYNIINLLLLAGFIISLCWYLSNKGYYYWTINYIKLIQHYEKKLLKFEENERVYFIFADKKASNNWKSPITGGDFSTPKLSILLSYLICMSFGNILIFNFLQGCIKCDNTFWLFVVILPILLIFVFSYLANKYLYSDMSAIPEL